MEKYLVVNHQDGAVLLNTQDGTIKPYNSDADIPVTSMQQSSIVQTRHAARTCPLTSLAGAHIANVACTF